MASSTCVMSDTPAAVVGVEMVHNIRSRSLILAQALSNEETMDITSYILSLPALSQGYVLVVWDATERPEMCRAETVTTGGRGDTL